MKNSLRILAIAIGLCVFAATAQAVEIINKSTPFRYFLMGTPDQYKDASGAIKTVRVGHADRTYPVKLRRSAPPPADWASVAFDDTHWPKKRCGIYTSSLRTFSLLCVRAKFRIDDPAGAKGLKLSLSFRGGVVVHLNGKELTRVHMPDGEIKPETPAEPYPKEAFLDPDGYLLRNGWGDSKKYPEHFKKRTRQADGIAIPAGKLRKGVNVLALELHRPLTDAVYYNGKHKPRKYAKTRYCPWSTLRLNSVVLTGPEGATAKTDASGLRVWNHAAARLTTTAEAFDSCEELKPLRIRGARNGAFSAKVVIGSSAAIRGLKGSVTDLAHANGGGKIPAAATLVRYALPDGGRVSRKGATIRFDGMDTVAPAEVPARNGSGAVQPVWVTVQVPPDAAPGDYKGKLTIKADGGKPAEVPIALSVADWTVPNTERSSSWYWLVQSPESLAKQYGVEMWSEKHWKLIGASFDLMRQVGTRIIYIPMFRQSHLGNQHTMVRWIKKPDGSYKHDLSIIQKYIHLAHDRLKKLDVVCLHCWPKSSGGAYFGRGSKEKKSTPIRFTLLDEATGKLQEAEGPTWGQPEMRAFWKPVLQGVHGILEKRGLADAMMVGIGHDTVPSKACVEDLKFAAPSAKWVVHCHPKLWKIHSVETGYLANVWGMPSTPFPDAGRAYGWKEKRFWTTFPRYGSGTIGTLRNGSPLAQYRATMVGCMTAGLKGLGWIGADFWSVLKGKGGRSASLLDSYTYDRRTNLGLPASVTSMLRPGKNGPVATGRLEMARQSLQEAEARAFIERALTDKAKCEKLGKDLADRAQKLLDDRIRAFIWAKSNWNLLLCSDWEKSSGALFAMAAEVEGKLKK